MGQTRGAGGELITRLPQLTAIMPLPLELMTDAVERRCHRLSSADLGRAIDTVPKLGEWPSFRTVG